jgi:hypothetical protein
MACMMPWSWWRSSTSMTKWLMPFAVVGDGDLGLGDIPLPRRDGGGDLREEARGRSLPM